jgi:hypothetical protein
MSLLIKKHQKIAEIYRSAIDLILKNKKATHEELVELAYVAGRQAGLCEATIYSEETQGFIVEPANVALQHKYIFNALTEE